MDIKLVAIVACGGATGAVLRYSIPSLFPGHYGISNTIVINLIGSLFVGILFGAISAGLDINEETILLIGTGFLGAFTTMSAFAIESMELIQENQLAASLYFFISVLGSIFFAWGGYSVIIYIMQ